MNLQQAYYESRFENFLRKAKGDEFQDLFERLMGLAYKADFMATRPWGNRGDRKNDGFLKSEKRLFQVYAPYKMTEAKAIKKITEDFEGAKQYWGTHFNKWVFVHNAFDGLPPHVQKVLLDFEDINPGITLEPWGMEELRTVFRKIDEDDLVTWLGAAPTDETRAKLGFQDLKVVLESITTKSKPSHDKVKDVPAKKIEANALSESVATLLKSGMGKAPLVKEFFEGWHDEMLGERVAEAFKAKYRKLRENMTPNEIFEELQTWAGGEERGASEHQLAVLTVLAYYFERCDIFEEPPG